VQIDRAAWEVPPLFRLIQSAGSVSEAEMFRVFNMGIGFILIVAPADVEEILAHVRASGEVAYRLGEVIKGTGVEF